MTDGLFLIHGNLETGDAQLIPMRQAEYLSEDVLQSLVARYPDLLAGGQMNPEVPRRWLLVKREKGVADSDGGADRWSLDHLFIDQDGTPTLVEVKRSSDTRIRREVVGQMLDYAANGVVYWPVASLRAQYETSVNNPSQDIAEKLGEDVDPDILWENVDRNMQEGRVRLVFLADEIPRELRRIVEFLNEQMRAEVLAVEVRQHVAADAQFRTLTTTVYGRTERAVQKKTPRGPGREKRNWTRESLLEVAETISEGLVQVFAEVLAWAERHPSNLRWKTGTANAAFDIGVSPPDGRFVMGAQFEAVGWVYFPAKLTTRSSDADLWRPLFDDFGAKISDTWISREIVALPPSEVPKLLTILDTIIARFGTDPLATPAE